MDYMGKFCEQKGNVFMEGEKMDFNDKTVIVTGGSQGIGRAICLGFSKAGAKVFILDVNEAGAASVAEEIEKEGGFARVYGTDVSNYGDVQKNMASILKETGRIDVLVNNAGIVDNRNFIELDEKDFDRVISINLKGVFNTCRHVLPIMMKQRHGKIVNIASIAGKVGGGIFGNTVYGTSKAGVIAMTKGLAREGGPYGINVNAICPGPVNTQMIADFKGEARANFLKGVPLRRFAEAEDIANVAMFLASDGARHVSGEITDVDGGIMRD